MHAHTQTHTHTHTLANTIYKPIRIPASSEIYHGKTDARKQVKKSTFLTNLSTLQSTEDRWTVKSAVQLDCWLSVGFWSSQVPHFSQTDITHNRLPQCPPASIQHLPPPLTPASSVNTHWYDSLPGVFARFKVQPQVKSCSQSVLRQREQKLRIRGQAALWVS